MENEFLDLPNDTEEAFTALEKRKRKNLDSNIENEYHRSLQDDYVCVLSCFDTTNDLKIFSNLGAPPFTHNEFNDYFQNFRHLAIMASTKIDIEIARKLKTGACNIVILDPSSRSAIHVFIGKIRDQLNLLEFTEAKRTSLFNKLNLFADEVDRNQTRTESFYILIADTWKALRKANKEAQPFLDTTDRILDQLERAKKLTDTIPSWEERLKIEPPKKQLPKPANLDENVPF